MMMRSRRGHPIAADARTDMATAPAPAAAAAASSAVEAAAN